MKDSIEIKTIVPDGYEIDEEHSTFECIRLKRKPHFGDNKMSRASGYYINTNGEISYLENLHVLNDSGWSFPTEEEARSTLAAAKLSHIIEHDSRFGGKITKAEWDKDSNKYVIYRYDNKVSTDSTFGMYHMLAFHTREQRDLFKEKYMDLIKQYLMVN